MALQTTMLGKLNLGSIGTKVLKKPAPAAKKSGTTTIKKAAPKPAPKKAATTVKKASAPKIVKKSSDSLPKGKWAPWAIVPSYLDGSLPGDRGFDPFGLAKPVEYLQVDIDSLDQNLDNNKAGGVIGTFTPVVDEVNSANTLAPYSEVFGIARFRECELIHGRWAMLATLGCFVAEVNTGVSWVDAGKVEIDGSTYFGFELPFTLTQVCWIEAILMLAVETYRNGETDPEKRCYPGGYFDPLNLAADPEKAFRLKEAEIKHGRLAMVAFFGFAIQYLTKGEGVIGSLAKNGLYGIDL